MDIYGEPGGLEDSTEEIIAKILSGRRMTPYTREGEENRLSWISSEKIWDCDILQFSSVIYQSNNRERG